MTTNTITALVQIEVTNEKRNWAKGEAETMLNTLDSVKSVTFPSISSAVTLDLNDAGFLAVLVTQYIAKGNNTDHLQDLVARLTPKAGC